MPEHTGESAPSPRDKLEGIRSITTSFSTELDAAKASGNYETVESLRQQIDAQIAALRIELSPVETILRLSEQYQSQRDILERSGLIERSRDGTTVEGRDAAGEGYPMPSLEQVRELLVANESILKEKAAQGFTKLLMVPFCRDIEFFGSVVRETVGRHFKPKKQLFTKRKADYDVPPDPAATKLFGKNDQPLALHTNNPVTIQKYNDEEFVYPNIIEGQREVSTKEQLLQNPHLREFFSAIPGWKISLIRDIPNIPETNADAVGIVGGRREIEKMPITYEMEHAIASMPQFRNEKDMTIEEWFMYMLTNIEERNQVIDEADNHGLGGIVTGYGVRLRGTERTKGAPVLACWNIHGGYAWVTNATMYDPRERLRTVVSF